MAKIRRPHGGHCSPVGVSEEREVAIYITRDTYKRLQGGGAWYEESRYATAPSKRFPVKTMVPESALEKGFFYPDRCECGVDDIAERCEEVIPNE